MDNTQLPAEVALKIKEDADKVYNKLDDLAHNQDSYDFGLPMINRETGPIIEILTEYATKLLHSEKVLALYKQADKTNSDLIERAVTLLEKVKSRHEAGLLPDTFIYNEIKSFLDGTK